MNVDYAAVILAGGGARRLGGVDKPALVVAGTPMIARVLDAVRDATQLIVVGPEGLPVPADEAVVVRERPPGGGPAAAVAAAFEQAPPTTEWVAILGSDMPLLTNDAIARLRQAALGRDGAAFVDRDDRAQWLCGVWRVASIRTRLVRMEHSDAPLHRVFEGFDFVRVRDDAEMPAWFDCDTTDDLKRAEEWLTR